MGREVKRVSAEFAWSLYEPWKGYIMPSHLRLDSCVACGGDGYTVEARAIAHTFYPHQIEGPNAGALAWHDKIGQAEVDYLLSHMRLTTLVERIPTEDNPRNWEWVALPRTAEEVNKGQFRMGGSGHSKHDAINRGLLVEFRCKVLGITLYCQACAGSGEVEVYPGQRAETEAWERQEPPGGDYWQIWETVSEGSPVTPTFASKEELAGWCERNGGARGIAVMDKASWLRFIEAGWAPSGVSVQGEGIVSGVEAFKTR